MANTESAAAVYGVVVDGWGLQKGNDMKMDFFCRGIQHKETLYSLAFC